MYMYIYTVHTLYVNTQYTIITCTCTCIYSMSINIHQFTRTVYMYMYTCTIVHTSILNTQSLHVHVYTVYVNKHSPHSIVITQ